MKLKKLLCLTLLFCFAFATVGVVKAETLPNVTDFTKENIETYNYDGNNYPDIRGKSITTVVYAYISPQFGHGSQDNPNLPAPFNKHYTYSKTDSKTFYTGAIKSGDGYDAYLFYCVGYGMPLDTNDTLLSTGSVYGWDENVLDDETKNLVSLALIYGFDSDPGHGSSVNSACSVVRNEQDGKHVWSNASENFATQVAVWLASTKKVNDPQADEIARYLFDIKGELQWEAYNYFSDIITKVRKAMKMPTYLSTDPNNVPVYELAWSEQNKRFECTLTDANELGLNGDKITIQHKLEGTGLQCDVNGNQVTLYTNSVVGSKNNPVRVTVQKDINNGIGVAGFWQKEKVENEKYGQPLTRLVDAKRTSEFGYYSVYTSGIRLSVYKDLTSTSGNLGDASPEGAIYGVYRDSNCTDLVTKVTIEEDGHSNKTEYIPYQTYYVKETQESPSTVKDPNTYTVDPATAAVDSEGDFAVEIHVYDKVKEGNVEILKRLGETDYDAEINLAGSRFELTLDSDPSQVYSTNKSGEDGICRVDNIPYGTYTAKEVEWPDESYPVENFKVVVTEDGKTYNFTKVDPSKKMQIEVEKVLLDELVGKTDAKVSGAYFTVYTDENATEVYKDKDGNPVIIGPTDNTGYAISGTMRTGTYYLKETTFPEGINPDAKVPGEDVTFRDKIYVASYDNKNQGTDVVTVSIKRIINISNLGSIEVIKYNNNPNSTDEQPAEGAILALTLKSNKDCVYYATIDENGYAEFINEDLQKLGYEYTIPYGEYEITEIEESNPKEHTSFYFQPETVEIRKDTQKEYRVFSDEPVPAWPRIVKKDKDTGESVPLAGATFKIWDCQNDKFVEQMETPSGEYIDEFVTNESGYLYTPQELQPGKYVVYETNAPEGYYLADELRLPADDKDLGDAKVSGKEFTINKVTTGLLDDAIYPEGGIETGSLVIEVTMEDPPLKVDLYLSKKGEKLTNSTSTTVSYKVNDNGETTVEEKYTPVYEEVGLEGVGYRIYAAENIYKPNGDIRVAVGTKVADITTNEDGLAVAKDLYPGEYRIEEYKTPEGYLKDENIPNVVLENEDQYVKNATVKKELSDVRQKLGLTFEKVFEDVKYAQAESSEPKALFGVYTKEIITNYKGEEVIPNNALMDLIWVDENGDVTSQIDLPEGTYYVKELYASYPYAISEKTVDFTLEYNDNSEQEFVVIEGEEFSNTPVLATLSLIKLSSTSFGEVTMVGDEIENESFESEAQQFLNEIKAMSIEQLREYLKEKNTKLVSDAKYSVYIDAGCTKPLYVYNEQEGKYVEAEFVTDGSGIITLEDIPLGEYYIKETVAPHGYELSEEVVHVTLTNENKDSIVYKILMDEPVVGTFITKTDIFTGEEVPNCVFEIRDEDDELLLKSVTDENGEATIPLDMFEDGKTYTYTEIKAPDIYDLNTEPHEFVAEFDDEGNWVTEKIEVNNRRKTREVIVRKLDAETGEPLKGCVFTIAMIDPETGEQKVNAKTGEPIYLVENVETDENGEYIIPEAPMGTYKFLEIKAPEGYELDEDLTGYTFTIDNNSPETIIFEVTNTGDIAVIAIASVAVICAVGIVFVIRRNKKQA